MNNLRNLRRFWSFIAFLILTPNAALAATGGIGGVAQNLLGPVGLLSDFVYTACFGIGGAFLFATIIKYMEHRRSPTMVPISNVIFLLVAGLVLLILPFLSYLLTGSAPYSVR